MVLLNFNKAAVVTGIPAPSPVPQEPLIECFDVAHYRAQLTAAGVAIPDEVDLIDFYKQTPEARLFSPNDVFDENYYLSYYDDIRAAVRSGASCPGLPILFCMAPKKGGFQIGISRLKSEMALYLENCAKRTNLSKNFT